MSEFDDLPTITSGIYEHYKGKRYQVLDVGCHTESHEYFVVYTPLYDHSGQPNIWVRPYEMFIGTVVIDNTTVPRFKKVA